jgi:hypothetical protein
MAYDLHVGLALTKKKCYYRLRVFLMALFFLAILIIFKNGGLEISIATISTAD